MRPARQDVTDQPRLSCPDGPTLLPGGANCGRRGRPAFVVFSRRLHKRFGSGQLAPRGSACHPLRLQLGPGQRVLWKAIRQLRRTPPTSTIPHVHRRGSRLSIQRRGRSSCRHPLVRPRFPSWWPLWLSIPQSRTAQYSVVRPKPQSQHTTCRRPLSPLQATLNVDPSRFDKPHAPGGVSFSSSLLFTLCVLWTAIRGSGRAMNFDLLVNPFI